MIRRGAWLICAGSTGVFCITMLVLGVASIAKQAEAAASQTVEGYGTIKGRLVWGGASAPDRVPIIVNKDPQVCGKVPLYNSELIVDTSSKGVVNGFAYLPAPKGSNPDAVRALLDSRPKVEVDQKNCEFIPVSTALHKDQALVFRSSDAVGHNVHYTGFGAGNSQNFALGPNDSAEKKLGVDKRPIELVCDYHGWMKGNLMVFDHPFFAVTGPDGSFEIRGVPAGAQKIVVWHRKVGYVTTGGSAGLAVEVRAGETTDVGDVVLDPAKVK